jgi:glycosyltransferase involved in cell wall biosynthesis
MLGAVPWVGAAGEVYGDLDGIGTTVLVPENADAWEEALENKISNLSQEQERALAFVPEARELFLIDSNLDKLEQVYKQIIADFDPHALVWPVPGIIEIGTGVLPSGEAKK